VDELEHAGLDANQRDACRNSGGARDPFERNTGVAWRGGMGCNPGAMEYLTITLLKSAVQQGRVEVALHAQVEAIHRKDTREGKPFLEVHLADAEGKLVLRAWSDSPAFVACEGLEKGCFVEVSGEFSQGAAFGPEAKRWTCRELSSDERAVLLAGSVERRARQDGDYAALCGLLGSIEDPRLKALCRLFLEEYGDRFRRAAAARANHHARRGGLVEHVAQMARSADAVATAYKDLNRDLLLAGVLFHDCGKLWENGLPADGFQMPFDERGELLGHITIGIELVNALWRKLLTRDEAREWGGLHPASEDVRMHLLHLLASHHGELQYGSPVVPKTPEAWALHYVDNLDAKLEMMHAAYAQAKRLAPRIHEKQWPLPGHLVEPLARFGR